MSSSPLSAPLANKRVLVCVGAGGVGKTTVSAALSVQAALSGRSSLVCTIDPARRLANSLGLTELGNTELRIPEETLRKAELTLRAPLFAMMLDMKKSWDGFIERHATEEQREKILANRFYQTISTRLAGSQEYIAMEKLWELRQQNAYDLIVLDTPPTAHALDFLDAPTRVLDFFDNEAARWLLTPALLAGKVGLQVLNLGSSFLTKSLAKLTGAETLQELASLLLATSSIHGTFRDRAKDVRALLAAPETAFVLVTAPHSERLSETIRFHALLKDNRMEVAAIVVNRVHVAAGAPERQAAEALPRPLRDKVLVTLDEVARLTAEDARALAELEAKCAPTPLVRIPRFDADVHDLAGLAHTARFLVGEATIS
jgi:anion-transporting  ArsA/GET3 family ATPase